VISKPRPKPAEGNTAPRNFIIYFNKLLIFSRTFAGRRGGCHLPQDQGFWKAAGLRQNVTQGLPRRPLSVIIVGEAHMSAESSEDQQRLGRVVPLAASKTFQPAWPGPLPQITAQVTFDRSELRQILNLYGRKVAAGEWRDYAIEFTSQKAVFSIYRRASEYPLYRIEKTPRLARKQGVYSVLAATGRVLKRSHDLAPLITALDKRLKLVSG
jgi:hypothetical protein